MPSRPSDPSHPQQVHVRVSTASRPRSSDSAAAAAAAAVVADAVAIALEAEAEAAAGQVLLTAAAIAAAAEKATGAAVKARGARAFAVAEAARLVANDAVRTAAAMQERTDASAAFVAEELRQAMEVVAFYDADESDANANVLAMRLIDTMRTLADASARDAVSAAAFAAESVGRAAAELAVTASASDVGFETEVTEAADALHEVSVVAARRAAGATRARAVGVAFTAREVAAAVRVEHLKDLDATGDDYLAIASHELRTPLTSIAAYAEMLQDVGGLTVVQAGFVDAIARNVGWLSSLTDDLLLLAGLDSPPLETEPLEVDLRTVLTSAEAIIATLGSDKNLAVVLDLPDAPVLVVGEARHLERVALNLLGNAIKFTDPGGTVTCRLSSSPSDAYVTFTDTGIGIPPAEQALLFDRFFRGSAARDRGIRGNGLGLHIVGTIVDSHGGDISVGSVAGQGSTFTVRLPRLITSL